MNIYYVYAYLRKNGTPYYIGMGHGSRAWDEHRHKNSKTNKWYGVHTPKDKRHIIIIESNLTQIGAWIRERYYIRWFGRECFDTNGILLNKSEGGPLGVRLVGELNPMYGKVPHNRGKKFPGQGGWKKGRPQSAESIAKRSATVTGSKRSEETKRKMSSSMKGNQNGRGLKGVPKSEEHKLALSKPKKQKPATCEVCGYQSTRAVINRYHNNKCVKILPLNPSY